MADCFHRVGGLEDVTAFKGALEALGLEIGCDEEVLCGAGSPLVQPIHRGPVRIGNRFGIHPMEGWDGTADGRPTEHTFRRWRGFGASGAKLIWGGEAVAVRHDGRANPNQLMIDASTRPDLERLREALEAEHRRVTGSVEGLLVGLQLTHSGRFSRPNAPGRLEPRILYHHPILDRRMGIPEDYPVLDDGKVRGLVEDFVRAAGRAGEAGFAFVDIKHCHGYLGHEFLSAHTRGGAYGGSFENRTRFLREVAAGIRTEAPGVLVGVRVSAFDTVPYRRDPAGGVGAPEAHAGLLPYRWGFGVDEKRPTEPDLREPVLFVKLLRDLNIRLVNVTAGSPYYNPHIQRPALYPPSDGYGPPEDPLVGVARQMRAVRTLKQAAPDLVFMGSAYTYLQEYLPHVAQWAVRTGWTDVVGIGRMALPYPQMVRDVLEGRKLDRRRICRTFSDCTTAPRLGLRSGCYPLDPFYKKSAEAGRLKALKGDAPARNAEAKAEAHD